MFGSILDEWLEEVNELYGTLDACRSKPHVLDDYTVGRVIEVYSTQAGDIWLFDEQICRWKILDLTPQQRRDVDRLTAQIMAISERITAILDLAEELKKGTIETVLAKSDLELGLEVLLGKRKLPKL